MGVNVNNEYIHWNFLKLQQRGIGKGQVTLVISKTNVLEGKMHWGIAEVLF